MIRPLKLGIVPYINVLPLLEGLSAVYTEQKWIRATPRVLGELLACGAIDVAAVSTFEGIRCAGDYRLVPGAGIGSDGPVRSVALYAKCPLTEVRSVLVDHASLTSSNLVRILARELLGIDPGYDLSTEPLSADYDWGRGSHDAVLVIGDVALQWENEFGHKLDLGEGWKRLTGLPFVFAGWWTRAGLQLSVAEVAAFIDARRRGQQNAATIADALPDSFAATHGGRASLRDYLAKAIRYDLGDRELEAIALFREKLLAHGLIPADTPPVTLAGGGDQETE